MTRKNAYRIKISSAGRQIFDGRLFRTGRRIFRLEIIRDKSDERARQWNILCMLPQIVVDEWRREPRRREWKCGFISSIRMLQFYLFIYLFFITTKTDKTILMFAKGKILCNKFWMHCVCEWESRWINYNSKMEIGEFLCAIMNYLRQIYFFVFFFYHQREYCRNATNFQRIPNSRQNDFSTQICGAGRLSTHQFDQIEWKLDKQVSVFSVISGHCQKSWAITLIPKYYTQ